jgi:hypothetical protein
MGMSSRIRGTSEREDTGAMNLKDAATDPDLGNGVTGAVREHPNRGTGGRDQEIGSGGETGTATVTATVTAAGIRVRSKMVGGGGTGTMMATGRSAEVDKVPMAAPRE